MHPLPLESLPNCPDLFHAYRAWASHPEVMRVPGGWRYAGGFYPDYLTVGGASLAIFRPALRHCVGRGMDIGAGLWPLPGAVPADVWRGPGAGRAVEDFLEGSLDYVFSSHCLEHIEDWETALSAWIARLRFGGALFLYLPHPDCAIWHPGSPFVGDGHKWKPTPERIVAATTARGLRLVEMDPGPDAMSSFFVCACKENGDSLTPPPRAAVALASVAELESPAFAGWMEQVNAFASRHGLRVFTDWSKVWEYPWLWRHGLGACDWRGCRLLDLGSEISPMPWLLATWGARVTLVEADSQWVPRWEKLRGELGVDVDWHISASERLPLADASFDVVTSFSVVEHQADKHAAVGELARVLRPGGRLAISFDICEPDMGMTFPEWNGRALTMREFEETVWHRPELWGPLPPLRWNVEDAPAFLNWNLRSAPHHNYVVGAAVLTRNACPAEPPRG